MKNHVPKIGRAALPFLAVVALAFALSQFNITANADTVSTASAAECSTPCDPSDCPMPCARECSGVKTSACAEQTVVSVRSCEASCVKAASIERAQCPCPNPGSCEKGADDCRTTAVAQLK